MSTIFVIRCDGHSTLTESARRHCRRIGSSAEAAVLIDGASETLHTYGKPSSEHTVCDWTAC